MNMDRNGFKSAKEQPKGLHTTSKLIDMRDVGPKTNKTNKNIPIVMTPRNVHISNTARKYNDFFEKQLVIQRLLLAMGNQCQRPL